MFNLHLFGGFNGRVDTSSKGEVEPQEVFLDKLSRKKEEELGISERKLEVPLPKWVLQLFAFVIFTLLFLLLGRSFQMQVIEGEAYESLAKKNRSIMQPTKVLRGVIYDQDGEQLVQNHATFDIYVKKAEIEDKDRALEKLVEIVDIKVDDLKQKFNDIEEEGVLVKDIDHESAVIADIQSDNFPGISLERTIERKYENDGGLSHILGYTGEVTREEINENPERYTIHDYIGKSGLEKDYDEQLARDRGSFEVEVDSEGNIKSEEEADQVKAGNNLELWIDADLQQKITESAEEVLKDIGSSRASVVALDPDTGGVLASVSIPSYDNNVFSRTGDKKLLNEFLTDKQGVFLNRAIEADYPTGSTIKPLLAAAALEENIISPQKEIHSPGYLDIPNPWDPTNPTRMMDFQAHGWTDMREAIAVSSNVYFYTIGGGHEDQEGLGIRRIKNYLNLFGWGSRTGIDLPNEKKGRIPDPGWKAENIETSWTLGDTYNTAIGQGYLTTTPMQVAVSYAALVNGGRVLEPKVVKSIKENGDTVQEIEPTVVREGFISDENLRVVQEGMKKTVEEGTATRLSWLPVDAGAKTGTAQIPKEGHYHNWVGAFAPYDDPEIVLVVLVEEVEGIRASSTRIAYDVLDWYFEDKSEKDNNQKENE
ncbi:MAG: penicillin-binding protein 2 [Patescibacteria group bacterium]